MRFIQVLGMIVGSLMSIIFFLFVLLIIISLFAPAKNITGGNIALIPINGIISTTGDGDVWEEKSTPSDKIIEWLEDADEDSAVKAILLDIDSPGGAPVATAEISTAIKSVEKPVIAVIREAGASGALWIATSADYVFAHPLSMTGSIGVTASRLEFAGLLENYNITYRQLSAGKYKDAGSRWKEMTQEEQALFQEMLDEVHQEFINAVAQNRGLSASRVKEFANGFVLTGRQAKELGMVDDLGTKKDAIKYIEQQLNITAKIHEFKPARTFLEEIIGISSYQAGKGLGTTFLKASTAQETSIKV